MARTRLRGIHLAGSRIAIEVPAHLDWSWPDAASERFRCSPAAPDVYVGVRVGTPRRERIRGVGYASATHRIEVASCGDEWRIGVHAGDRLERVAVFDRAFAQGEVTIDPAAMAAGVAPLCHPLDQIVALHRSARAGALMLRGRVVQRVSGAVLELGGPAHAPRLQRRHGARLQALASDRLLVRPGEGGEVYVQGTPWHSDAHAARPFCARIGAIHVLTADRGTGEETLDRDAAMQALLAHVFAPVHDEQGGDRLFETAAQLVGCIEVVRRARARWREVAPFTRGSEAPGVAFAAPHGE